MMLHQLSSDIRTVEHRIWTPWLQEATRLAGRFNDELEGDDPFAYNETASVSLLTAAAVRSGNLALAEFTTTKKAANNRRKKARGRSDFWMLTEGRSWAFEFKQISNGTVTSGRVASKMIEARKCASCIREVDADKAIAGLIVPLFFLEENQKVKARTLLMAYAKTRKFAWLISGRTADLTRDIDAEPEVFLFFDVVR